MIQQPSSQHSFLEDIDARQDEVLRQLDELNLKLECLLNETALRLHEPGDDEGALSAA